MSIKLSGPMLPPQTGGAPRQLVVLLHGYGADGNDLIGLGLQWREQLPEALFVAPNAPEPATMAGGGLQWFDIELDGDRLASRQEGVVRARPVLVQFLSDLWAQTGLGAQDTLVVGFSQGAMLALDAGLSLSEPLMGIVAFSGALLSPAGAGAGWSKPPVCLVHGDEDNIVDPARSVEAETILRGAGVPVERHLSAAAGHGIAPDGLAFASAFIDRIMTARS